MLHKGGRTIQTRWIDTNKGDSEKLDYRPSLVGKVFNVGVDHTLFAATPRACFHARVSRDIYVELPEEDRDPANGDMVGKMEFTARVMLPPVGKKPSQTTL